MEFGFSIYCIAEKYGLEIISTTVGMNGYPKQVRKALVGFENFDEATKVANENGMRVTTFFRKNGWDLWVRTPNQTYGPLNITSIDYGEGYEHYYSHDAQNFYEQEVKPFLDSFTNVEELEDFVRGKCELLDQIRNMNNDEILIAHQGKFYDVLDINSMQWSFDTNNWVIGIIKDN